jgi:hypothetical protein
VTDVLHPPPRKANGHGKNGAASWWSSHAGIDAKGRELGMQARGNESYDDFKSRIFERLGSHA